jgi:ribonuclease D
LGRGTIAIHEFIADTRALDRLIRRLLTVDRYALDTEFHRERTYWPQLALVQVAWDGPPDEEDSDDGQVAIIDPLAVDIRPLARVLESPAVMVAHAAEQDVEVLVQACGVAPSRLLDTQIAGGFLGHGSASLSGLTSQLLDRHLPKGDRLTDWSRRPLTDAQRSYAAADVAYLLDLADAITSELEEGGRLAWAEEECQALLDRASRPADPERVWWKLRNARQLRGQARGVAQEVAAWRERRAQEIDQPARFVLPDLALQAIIHGRPDSAEALRRTRGLDGHHLRGPVVSQLLEAVKRGLDLPEDALHLPPADEVDRELRPAIALATAWVAQLAREERIDAALLATRSDLVAYFRPDSAPTSRLGQGWRARMVGEPLARLVAGEAAIAFDGRGGLVLEARSHRAVQPE